MHKHSAKQDNPTMQMQIDDLQSRVAFQEDALQVMSEQVAGQADELRRLREHVQLVNQKLNNLLAQEDAKSSTPQDERPPHY